MVATIEKCGSEVFALFAGRCRSYVVPLKHLPDVYFSWAYLLSCCGDVLKSLDVRELAEEGWIFCHCLSFKQHKIL